MKVMTLQGDTLDLLCWRHYGRTQGIVEQILNANPGLVELGAVLPMGYCVELPDLPAVTPKKMLQLWD